MNHKLAIAHSLTYNMSDGLFVEGRCVYCNLNTIDYCPVCSVYVCRRCDMPRHWTDVGVVTEAGFAPGYRRVSRRPGR